MGSPNRDCPFLKQEKKGFFRDRSEKDERMPAAELTDSGKKQHESAAYSQELLVKLWIFVYNILCIIVPIGNEGV